MNEEKKDYKKENKKRMLIALAILLGFIDQKEDFSKLSKPQLQEVNKVFEEKKLEHLTNNPERLSERDIQIEAAEIGIEHSVQLYKIVGVKDNNTCPDCAKWQGKKVSMTDGTKYPTVQEFINEHGFHPNCRCSLQEIKDDEIPLKKNNPRYESRKQQRPDIYNCKTNKVVNSNMFFKLF